MPHAHCVFHVHARLQFKKTQLTKDNQHFTENIQLNNKFNRNALSSNYLKYCWGKNCVFTQLLFFACCPFWSFSHILTRQSENIFWIQTKIDSRRNAIVHRKTSVEIVEINKSQRRLPKSLKLYAWIFYGFSFHSAFSRQWR